MGREEIVKALECCTKGGSCGACPYDGGEGCIGGLLQDALALIRELIKENEDLEESLETYYRQCPTF